MRSAYAWRHQPRSVVELVPQATVVTPLAPSRATVHGPGGAVPSARTSGAGTLRDGGRNSGPGPSVRRTGSTSRVPSPPASVVVGVWGLGQAIGNIAFDTASRMR